MALKFEGLEEVVGIFNKDKEAKRDDSINSNAGLPLMLKIEDIVEDDLQPRKHMNEEDLKELSESIALYGVQQAIIVRDIGNAKYKIVAGHRRFRASKLANKTHIPAFLDTNEKDAKITMILQLTENIHRENLTDIEIAEAMEYLLNKGVKQKELATLLNKSKVYVSEHLSLLKLPHFLKEAFKNGKISDFRSVMMLAKTAEKYQEATKKFIDTFEGKISRNAVEIFLGKKEASAAQPETAVSGDITTELASGSLAQPETAVSGDITTELASGSLAQPETAVSGDITTELASGSLAQPETVVSGSLTSDTHWKKTTFKVEYNGNDALVLLQHRCRTNSAVLIKMDHDGSEKEVEISSLKFKCIVEVD